MWIGGMLLTVTKTTKSLLVPMTNTISCLEIFWSSRGKLILALLHTFRILWSNDDQRLRKSQLKFRQNTANRMVTTHFKLNEKVAHRVSFRARHLSETRAVFYSTLHSTRQRITRHIYPETIKNTANGQRVYKNEEKTIENWFVWIESRPWLNFTAQTCGTARRRMYICLKSVPS